MATTITTTASTTPNTSFGYSDAQTSTGLKILTTAAGSVPSLLCNLYKVGTPTGTLTAGLQADVAGVPSNIFLASGTLDISTLGSGSGNKADYTITFGTPYTVADATNYWAVLTPNNTRDSTNYIVATGSTSGTYNGGVEKLGTNLGVWSDDTGYDRFEFTISSAATYRRLGLLGVGQ